METETSPLPRVVAPGPPTFALHTLGWRAFQDLAAVVLREVLGQSVQSFADSGDAGRDGAFYGTWRRNKQAARYASFLPSRSFVLQCKHTAREDATLTPSMFTHEFTNVRALVDAGLCHSYLLLTNARITASSEARIRRLLRDAGVEHPLVLGGGWISQTIAAHRELRMFVPRVYGLGDLSQILDERAYGQAQALLRYLREELSTFVVTDAYRHAAEALRQHGFVLLLGEPAAGKTVIAATLAMTALDSWGCATIKAHDASELIHHWNPHEPNQFFWVDDAFGVVRQDWALTQEWARRLPTVMTAVKNGAKVVLTSRDYIYRDARRDLKEYAYPRLRENQVVVDVAQLSREERERILYNHVRLGDQPSSFRRSLKPYLDTGADVQPFRPEAARRLGRRVFTSGLVPSRRSVVDFIANPAQFLEEIYGQLDSDHRAALSLIYMAGHLPAFIVEADCAQLAVRLGSSLSAVGTALEALDGTFVRYGSPGSGGEPGWAFHHPTLREGFAAFVGGHPHMLDVFVAGLTDDALLTQIDCGSGTAQGTLVSIPAALYPAIAQRLAGMDHPTAEWARRSMWNRFFVNRCSAAFLRTYLETDSEFVPRLLRFHSYLSVAREPEVLARLSEVGLLAETDRIAAVTLAGDLAVETPDADWLDAPEWQVLMTTQDRVEALDRVRIELLGDLDNTLSNWRWNYDKDHDPDDYYRPLEEALSRYRSAMPDDPTAQERLAEAIAEVHRMRQDAEEEYEPPARLQPIAPLAASHGQARRDRSVFDDVDA